MLDYMVPAVQIVHLKW